MKAVKILFLITPLLFCAGAKAQQPFSGNELRPKVLWFFLSRKNRKIYKHSFSLFNGAYLA